MESLINADIYKLIILTLCIISIIVCIASFVVYEAATVHNKYYKDEKNLQITYTGGNKCIF